MRSIILLLVLASFVGMQSCGSADNHNSTTKEKSEKEGPISSNDTARSRYKYFCTELPITPPRQLNVLNDKDTVVNSYGNGRIDSVVVNSYILNSISSLNIVSHREAVVLKSAQWPQGTTVLTVVFLDGDSIVKRRVMQTAKKWENYCAVKFDFRNDIAPIFAQITISFSYPGTWSAIGKESLKSRPSMNYSDLYANSTQFDYDYYVLHEFGHALGMVHEHQHPAANIPWDSVAVYEYYKSTQIPPWSKGKVDTNVFMKYASNHVNSTKFDRSSIMLYAIPSTLTNGRYTVGPNNNISALDAHLLDSLYPRSNIARRK